ncbi:MAG: ADP-glyceromanno-heptose 6-epimerase, partial [Flavobacteriales bacterium]
VTGVSGFIASALVARLNQDRFFDLVLVDDFKRASDHANHESTGINFAGKQYLMCVDRSVFPEWLETNQNQVQFVFHLGARTDTAEQNWDVLQKLNLEFSKQVWGLCKQFQIPCIYASSAATYGSGENGYSDSHTCIDQLKPLNPYGISKNDFDKWVISQEDGPFFWAGLKFFNVYGPNEYHKGRMASVIFHAYQQIKESGKLKLFKSHREGIADGEQKRDFVYVMDVVEACIFLMHHRKNSGIYNLGSGNARSFNDLAVAVFNALNMPVNIEYIDTPVDIRNAYQYYTCAEMAKLKSIGFHHEFNSLDSGVDDYVKNYLEKNYTIY